MLDIKMKIKLLLIFLLLTVGIAPFTYKWWPPSRYQDYAILLAHSEDLLSLYEYSDITNFESIRWCKDDLYNNFRRNGRALTGLEIADDPEVKKFFDYAATKKVPCFYAQKNERHWLIHAGKDGFKTELNGKPATSQIARYYYISKSPNELGCTERVNVESKLLICSHHIFSDWYMLEETVTYRDEDVTNHDI